MLRPPSAALFRQTISIMANKARNSRLSQAVTAVAVAAFWLFLWALLARLIRQEILLPTPVTVAVTLWRLWQTAAFWQAVGLSLLRVLSGFLAAVAAGSLLAVVISRWRVAAVLLEPVLHIVRAAPVASFILLCYFWVQLQLLPGFIAFLMVLPLVCENVRKGIAQTDGKLLEMARVYRLGRRATLREVWLPSVWPYFEAACTAGLGFAWKSGIAAEVICSPDRSIGKYLFSAKSYLETPEVFAWTVTVVLLSVGMEWLLKWLVPRMEVKA